MAANSATANARPVEGRPMTISIDIDKLIQPTAILLAGVLISGSILFTGLRGGSVAGSNTTTTTGTTAPAPTPTPTTAAAVNLDTIKNLYQGDYIKFGDENRPVLFVEVADPSCPYCHIAAGKNPTLNKSVGTKFTLSTDGGSYVAPVPEMRKLVDEGKASYLFMYTPGHGNGELGVRAFYCAQEQGKFWDVHDKVMTSEGYSLLNDQIKNDLGRAGDLAEFLKSVIDPGFLKDCITSGKYDSRLQSEPAQAASLGVSGTPGYFINATSFPGAYNWTDMKNVAESALQ